MKIFHGLGALALLITLAIPTSAKEVVITVGGDKAAGKAAGKWAKNPTKGFKAAAAALTAEKGNEVTVKVKIAAGEYDGDMGSGGYELPAFQNGKATLHIMGGYSADFSKRDPFRTPTRLITVKDRSIELLKFFKLRPRDEGLKGLILDGLLFDLGNSNVYDPRANSLLYGKSKTRPMIAFNYQPVEFLEIQHCVFVNAAERCFMPLIRPTVESCYVRLYNNIFLNNRYPLRMDVARGKIVAAKLEIDHCSFLINWAYNPDPDTGNPAACELGNQYSAKSFVIKNSLYYANFGGAIMALNKSIALTCNNNNFVGNGLLHGSAEPDAAALILIAGNKKHPVNVDTIEDADFVTESEGNVSIAAGIPLSLGNVKVVDSSKVKAEPGLANDLNRLFGRNLQGGKVDINDYAPRQEYDGNNPPFPTVEEAKKYGASPDLVKD